MLNNVSGGTMSINLGLGDNTLNLKSGTNALGDIFNAQHINGTVDNDTLTVTNGIGATSSANVTVDLGGGDDTLSFGGNSVTITALGIEHITGTGAGDNFLSLNNQVTGLSIDLGDGTNDSVTLAGSNSLSVTNVEHIYSKDFTGPASDDVLTLTSTVSGALSINLFAGTGNTVNLAAGTNSLADIYAETVNGTNSADTLTVSNTIFTNNASTAVVDLGADNDTLNVNGTAFNITVRNVETVNGGANNDTFIIDNAAGVATTVTGGLGIDHLTAGAGDDTFRFASAQDSGPGGAARDIITDFNADHDFFDLSDLAGVPSSLTFVTDFNASGQSEARLSNDFGMTVLQIDLDGNGAMTSADIEVQLVNLTGVLSGNNFLLV